MVMEPVTNTRHYQLVEVSLLQQVEAHHSLLQTRTIHLRRDVRSLHPVLVAVNLNYHVKKTVVRSFSSRIARRDVLLFSVATSVASIAPVCPDPATLSCTFHFIASSHRLRQYALVFGTPIRLYPDLLCAHS
ncbi:hypothetical protein PsorP6_011523 [Peronosclerospora sorghi]|uniref:Uncharacterized protein n=1 Tax=Peronosclerospora sorghi TaxID=230839 RepID=A0ACC0WIJ8_9STRA|nr:hypothetical protein PsorP6_011523 [Peronosclerospora sorghi]